MINTTKVFEEHIFMDEFNHGCNSS